jgi:hypothetical protein
MSWFVDNAATLYILFGLVAAGLVVAWRFNQRVKFLGYAAGVLAVMGLLWLLSLFVPTDRKQLRDNVDAMAKAVIDGNVDDLFKHISKDFRYESGAQKLTRDQLYEAARGVIKNRQVGGINITRFKVESVSRADKNARVKFGVNAYDTKGAVIGRFDVDGHFELEGEHWKLKSVDFYQFNSTEKMGIPGL